jgi:metal-sulfur cluster biosynthetic enzyme
MIKKPTKDDVMNALTDVLDPELNISIVDLGLVYNVAIEKDTIAIDMTLTTIGCPLFASIEKEVKEKLKTLGFDEDKVTITLTFDPPWDVEKLSPRAKAILGI